MIKNIFYYLLAFITLCYSVWHLLAIIFNAIEKKVPDILDDVYNYSYSYNGGSYNNDSFRFSIASLVIMLPIYIAISWYINRQIEKGQMEADSKVRHTMIYTTILFSILSIAGSLVSVIYSYLGGEITDRFVYKALSVSLVSIAIGVYYYYTLNRNYKIKTNKPIIIAVSVLVIVFAICTYSVIIIGSPSEIRNKKLDQKSLSNLTSIESGLFYNYNNESSNINGASNISRKLPIAIDTDSQLTYYNIDPNTSKPYPYRVISQDKDKAVFELCPTFASELIQNYKNRNDYNQYGNYGNDFIYDKNIYLSHNVGRVCYQTTLIKKNTNVIYDKTTKSGI